MQISYIFDFYLNALSGPLITTKVPMIIKFQIKSQCVATYT